MNYLRCNADTATLRTKRRRPFYVKDNSVKIKRFS